MIDNKRYIRMGFYFTEEINFLIRKNSKELHLSIFDYIRLLIFNVDIPFDTSYDLNYLQLKNIKPFNRNRRIGLQFF